MQRIESLLDLIESSILLREFCLEGNDPLHSYGLLHCSENGSQINAMKERYHVTFSSWDYDLSSCIQELFKEMELAKRKRPVMDVLFQFLSKRVQLDFVIFS